MNGSPMFESPPEPPANPAITSENIQAAVFARLTSLVNPHDELFADLTEHHNATVLITPAAGMVTAETDPGTFEGNFEISIVCEDQEAADDLYRWAWHDLDCLSNEKAGDLILQAIYFGKTPTEATQEREITSEAQPGRATSGNFLAIVRKA